MPELTLKLTIDPETGKKTLVADYHGDADALYRAITESFRRERRPPTRARRIRPRAIEAATRVQESAGASALNAVTFNVEP